MALTTKHTKGSGTLHMSAFNATGDVSSTSVLIAHFRALESTRDDALFEDPLASALVEASGLPVGQAKLEHVITSRVYESVAARTRYLDDRIEAAVSRGARQVVLPAAGLDTRAYRLGLPDDVAFFEVDLENVFAFKEPVLEQSNAKATGPRSVVPADLTGDWVKQLTAAGFDADVPTVWVLEGILMYLTDEQNDQILDELSAVSAPGSELLFVSFAPGMIAEEQTKELAGMATAAGIGFKSHVADPVAWVGARGWVIADQTTIKEFGATIGRDVPYDEAQFGPVTWLVHAIRAE